MADLVRYPGIMSLVAQMPWAIRAEKLAVICDVLAFRMAGNRLSTEEMQALFGAAGRGAGPAVEGVAVLPLLGTIAQRADLMTQSSGGTSTQAFARGFRAALADNTVGAIVIDVDSPGGMIYGVEELAAEIFQARGQKPLIAVANSEAASAAYWIASAADQVSVTPGGEVGSIGVFAAHEDLSKALEQEGVKVSLIRAGKYKAETNPWEPLSDEARAYVQSRVDDGYRRFVRDVARNRGVGVEAVRTEFGEGRMVGAPEAVRRGMADRVETLEEAVDRAKRGLRRAPRGRDAAADAGADVFLRALLRD